MADLWGQPEWMVLRGETPAGVRATQAAIAAEFSIITLSNPLGSGMIVVAEEAGFLCATASTGAILEFALDSQALATLAGATATVSRDRRVPSVARSIARSGSDPAATLGGQQLDQSLALTAFNAIYFRVLPVIL